MDGLWWMTFPADASSTWAHPGHEQRSMDCQRHRDGTRHAPAVPATISIAHGGLRAQGCLSESEPAEHAESSTCCGTQASKSPGWHCR